MATHLTVVEIFQTAPKWWANQQIDIAIFQVMLLAKNGYSQLWRLQMRKEQQKFNQGSSNFYSILAQNTNLL